MMGGGGGMFWFLVVTALVVVPFWRLLPKFGLPSWVAVAAVIPFGAIVLLWVMAFKDRIDANGGA